MATYQQNHPKGASYGYVKYTITPDYSVNKLNDDDTITITGEAYLKNNNITGIDIDFRDGYSDTWHTIFSTEPYGTPIQKTISKGTKGSFSTTIPVSALSIVNGSFSFCDEDSYLLYDASTRAKIYPIFSLETSTDFIELKSTTAQKYNGLYVRNASHATFSNNPCVISDLSTFENASVYDEMGTYVQNKSKIQFKIAYNTGMFYHTIDFKLSGGSLTEDKTIRVYGSSSSQYITSISKTLDFNFSSVDFYGNLTWECTITDVTGNIITSSGAISVAPYTPPDITAFQVTRYISVLSDDGIHYEESDEGNNVWVDLIGNAVSINGNNTTTLSITCQQEDNTQQVYNNVYLDGVALNIHESDLKSGVDNILSQTFASNSDFIFRVTITDRFEELKTAEFVVQKAGAVFDVEPNGVAVGMRSTATDLESKFECAYPAQFFSNVAVPNNGLLKVIRKVCFTAESIPAGETKSGTVNITSTDTGEGWTAIGIVGYSSGMSWFNVHRLRLAIDSNSIIEYSVANVDKSSVHNASLGAMVLCVRTSLVDT